MNNMKRIRPRNHRQGGGGGGGSGGSGSGGGYRPAGQQPMNRNHVFESIAPDIRLRGTAQQLFEKYLQLGRDATGGGDRVMAESYFQHAEHYFRILNAMSQAQPPQPHAPQRRYNGMPEGEGEGYGEQPDVNGHAGPNSGVQVGSHAGPNGHQAGGPNGRGDGSDGMDGDGTDQPDRM